MYDFITVLFWIIGGINVFVAVLQLFGFQKENSGVVFGFLLNATTAYLLISTALQR
jgi:hypothetical protein